MQLCPGEGQGRHRDPEAGLEAAWNRGAAHSREEEGDGSSAQGKQQQTERGKENEDVRRWGNASGGGPLW
jgi:hypothetical protein